jgi:hypothetical protein
MDWIKVVQDRGGRAIVNYRKFLGQLTDYQLLKMDSSAELGNVHYIRTEKRAI